MGNTQARDRAGTVQITDFTSKVRKMTEPDRKDKKQKRTSDIEALKSMLPHPYITGQGLKSEVGESDSPTPDSAPPEEDNASD